MKYLLVLALLLPCLSFAGYSPEESQIPPFEFSITKTDGTVVNMNVGLYIRIIDGTPVFTIAYQHTDGSWRASPAALQDPLTQVWIDVHGGSIEGYLDAHLQSWNRWLDTFDPEVRPELDDLLMQLNDALQGVYIQNDRLMK